MIPFEELTSTDEWQAASPEARQKAEDLYASDFWQELSSHPEFKAKAPEERAEIADMFAAKFTNGAKIVTVANKPAQPSRSWGDVATDIGISGAKGVVDLGEAVVGAANLLSGGIVGSAMNKIGYDPKATQDFLDKGYSPAQQYANQEVDTAKGFVDTGKAMLEYPSSIVHGVVESAPSMLGGAGVARNLLQTGAKMSPVVAGAMGEGAIGAGQQSEQIRQESPDKTLTGKQAALSALSGVGTAAFGYAGGRLAQKLGFTDIDTFLATKYTGTATTDGFSGLVGRVVGGGISESVFEEMPQSAQERVLYNAAMGKPLMDGVPESTAQGGVIGAAMGGGANILTIKPAEKQPADILQTNSVDEAIDAFSKSIDQKIDGIPATLPTTPFNGSQGVTLADIETPPYQSTGAYDAFQEELKAQNQGIINTALQGEQNENIQQVGNNVPQDIDTGTIAGTPRNDVNIGKTPSPRVESGSDGVAVSTIATKLQTEIAKARGRNETQQATTQGTESAGVEAVQPTTRTNGEGQAATSGADVAPEDTGLRGEVPSGTTVPDVGERTTTTTESKNNTVDDKINENNKKTSV